MTKKRRVYQLRIVGGGHPRTIAYAGPDASV
jgi:hypothetical protein